MGVVYSEDSKYMQEMRKWDTPKHLGGMNASGYEPYPKMLYLARQNEQGHFMVGDYVGMQSHDLNRVAQAEAFTKSCQITVHTGEEHARYEAQGWRNSPTAALEYALKQQEAVSTAAAEEQYRVARMSEPARREFDQADRGTSEHLPTLPAPKKRAGRRVKVSPPVEPAA